MISIEALPEGFALSAGGRRILTHTRRSPCIELGRGELSVKQSKGRFSHRSRRVSREALRAFKIVESDASFAVIDFEGALSMAVRESDGRIRLSFSRYDSSIDRFRIRIAARPEESVFGCGERFSRLDLKRRRVALWVRERGPGGGLGLQSIWARRRGAGGDMRSSSKSVPAFASTDGSWCAVDVAAYTVVDFRRSSTAIESWAVPREIVIGSAEGAMPDAAALVADMSAFLGKAPAFPSWAFDGAWLGCSGGIEALERALGAVREAGAAVAAAWVPDWCGIPSAAGRPRAASEWSPDDSLYPRLADGIAALRSGGLRFVGRIDPYLSPDGRLGAEASARGFCVKDPEGGDYLVPAHASPVAMVDLTNPSAFAWIKGVISRDLIGLGMSAWAADGGELLPADAVLASGESGAEAHDRWPALWAKANREAIDEAGRATEAFFFMRSAWIGSARFATAFACGDQLPALRGAMGLEGAIVAALSSCFAGAAPWHSEAGGGTDACRARREPETLARWIEMAAFTPLLRTSARGRPDARGRKAADAMPWSDPLALEVFARMSQAFAALKPYHIAVAAEAAERAMPPIRHPWVHYQGDPEARRLTRQFLYGRDLMVAPCLVRGSSLTDLYLPDDEWVHLWTSRSFRGGSVSIESPPGYPAVFYRADSAFAPHFDAMRRAGRRP
jgi:sulfoquinovosidase